MDGDRHHSARPLADIVASCPPWHRARLSTILLWPTLHGGWTAILSYAHYTTVQPGEPSPPDDNLTYPQDTHHPLALDGTDAAVQAQVRDLAQTGTVGTLTLNRVTAPPWTPGSPVSPGWTICTHSGSEAERRKWPAVPDWLFVGYAGEPLDGSGVRKALARVLKAAGLPGHFSPHCFRHSYAAFFSSKASLPPTCRSNSAMRQSR